jgi:hypothetical protein
MRDLEEIESELRADPSELRERIVLDVGSFTVALLSVTGSGPAEKLQFAGTGTLVTDKVSHYILTAKHVWDEILDKAVKGAKPVGVGITLRPDREHKFFIPREAIVPIGPAAPPQWNEWGPDLVFLRVPPAFLGRINAVKVFYPIDGFSKIKTEQEVHARELHLLMGTPKEKGQYTETFADLQIIGMPQNIISQSHEKDGWDYLDLEMDLSLPNIPQSFGGVSGGGLWKVLVYRRPGSSKTSWMATLEGVAFHQSDPENDHRIVRCHGMNSIRKAFPSPAR